MIRPRSSAPSLANASCTSLGAFMLCERLRIPEGFLCLRNTSGLPTLPLGIVSPILHEYHSIQRFRVGPWDALFQYSVYNEFRLNLTGKSDFDLRAFLEIFRKPLDLTATPAREIPAFLRRFRNGPTAADFRPLTTRERRPNAPQDGRERAPSRPR